MVFPWFMKRQKSHIWPGAGGAGWWAEAPGLGSQPPNPKAAVPPPPQRSWDLSTRCSGRWSDWRRSAWEVPRAGPEPEYKDARVHHQTLAPAPLDLSLPICPVGRGKPRKELLRPNGKPVAGWGMMGMSGPAPFLNSLPLWSHRTLSILFPQSFYLINGLAQAA